jgi:ADP-ribose pyrophosphatase
MVVPITRDGNILFLREFRFWPEAYVYNFPCGAVEHESIEITVRRELEEETWYTGGRLLPLGEYIVNGYIRERSFYFLLLDCEKTVDPSLQDIEDIEVFEKSIPEFEMMIERNEITCPYTTLAFYLAKAKTHNFTQF